MAKNMNFPEIPDYQPLCMAGKGSFGEVYLALDALEHLCALKVIHWENFESIEDYKREFDALRAYMVYSREHDGLVSIHHVGGNPGEEFYYYVMDPADPLDPDDDIESYAPLTLKEKIDSSLNGIPPSEVLDISIQLASALNYLHSLELLHRDIKPDNIVFINGKPKLTDPGLVKGAEAEGSFVGTHGYIAPEGPGYGSDQYALGKTIYRMLTGNHAKDFPEIPTKCLEGKDAELSFMLNDVCNKACEYNLPERFKDVGELEEFLLDAEANLAKSKGSISRNRFSRRTLWVTGILACGAISIPLFFIRPSQDPEEVLMPSCAKIAGWEHSFYLDQEGRVWACGNNEFSQLGIPGKEIVTRPTQVRGLPSGVVAVATGINHSLFLTNNGSVWGVGQNKYGQLGLGDFEDRIEPIQIPYLKKVYAIAASGDYSLLLYEDGTPWGMGKAEDWLQGNKDNTPINKPSQIKGLLTDVDKMVAGIGHAFFIFDGQLYGLGSNQLGQLGDGTKIDRSSPSLIPNSGGIVELSTGYDHTLFIKNDGSLWGFGQNHHGQLGQLDKESVDVPVSILSPKKPMTISCGQYFSLVLMEDKTLYGMGSNVNGQLGVSGSSTSLLSEIAVGVDSIWAGRSHSLFTKDGKVYSTGGNEFGQLGDGTFESKWKAGAWNLV